MSETSETSENREPEMVETPNGPRRVAQEGDPIHYPVWKDPFGNLFMQPYMPLATPEEAEAAGRSCCEIPVFGEIFQFSHVASLVYNGAGLELEHIPADEILPGLVCCGGPALNFVRGREAEVN